MLYNTFQSNILVIEFQEEKEKINYTENIHVFENKMVDDFLKLRVNIDPQIPESQQILSRIQKQTKAKSP